MLHDHTLVLLLCAVLLLFLHARRHPCSLSEMLAHTRPELRAVSAHGPLADVASTLYAGDGAAHGLRFC
jgi:hypothetical protein